MPQIELRQIQKTYRLGETVIDAVKSADLLIKKGEFISIVGHSGSGKTSLLSIMGGVLTPTSGNMLFEGTDVYSLAEDAISAYRADKVGYIFQFTSLLPVLTSLENLLLPTIFATSTQNGARERALEYLDMVGLKDRAGSYPSELSGGQQRRVAIARALMNSPHVILADEPTGDLDEETEAEVMDILKRINSEKGITLILVTHSSALAADAGRQLRMTNGLVQPV